MNDFTSDLGIKMKQFDQLNYRYQNMSRSPTRTYRSAMKKTINEELAITDIGTPYLY